MQADALTLQADALTLQANALTLQADALTLQADALTLQADALTLLGIAKLNLLRINKMLYGHGKTMVAAYLVGSRGLGVQIT